MEVICVETEAFYQLLEEAIKLVKKNQDEEKQKWLQNDEVMKLLGIKSKTTLQKLRNEGQVRYSQPMKKIILYDRDSIMDYLERHARDIF